MSNPAENKYGTPTEADSPEFATYIISRFDIEGTLQVLKEAIVAEQFKVVQEINTQQLLASAGITIDPVRQIFFFRPDYMRQLLTANPVAILEAPLKVVVMEGSDGKVLVRYSRPTNLFSRYSGLADLGKRLEAVVERVINSVVKAER